MTICRFPWGCAGAQDQIDLLRAERNRLVEATDLGRLSEALEADNMAAEASMVRAAMHRLADLERTAAAAEDMRDASDAEVRRLRAALEKRCCELEAENERLRAVVELVRSRCAAAHPMWAPELREALAALSESEDPK
jgi:hypothetical protein